jgi:single-strand DNA-binding protein
MSQGGYVTLVGFVAREPVLRATRDKRLVADVRIGATTRVQDRETREWRDGETSYYTVNCWRRLAEHAKASLRKGDPVVVKGRFRTHTYQDGKGRIRTEAEIVADTIGHDLSRGIANYIRPERPRVTVPDDLAEGETMTGRDDQGLEGAVPGVIDPPLVGPGSRLDINEDAVEDFGRELSDDGAMARELGEPEAEEPTGVSVPF